MSAAPAAPSPEAAGGLFRRIALVVGPLAGIAGIVAGRLDGGFGGLTPAGLATLGCIVWVALWWIGECMPIGATSLLPLVVLPASGALSSDATARTYMDRHIMLMAAGFMAALAIERWGLHRRLALAILLRVGTSPRRLVLGMLVGAVVASMWMANTAATLIMLPIGLALIDRVGPSLETPVMRERFTGALLLAIAYGASLGGMGTPIGSPPNLIYLAAVDRFYGAGTAPSFVGWMAVALPVVVVMSAVVYLYLVHRLRLPKGTPGAGREVLLAERAALGPITREERIVAGVFGAMMVLWITRKVDLGGGHLIGWSPWLGLDATVDDTTVAVLGTLALFLWPTRRVPEAVGAASPDPDHALADGTAAPGASPPVAGSILDWATARRIPWEVVLLFGGGLALARACMDSGLSDAVAGGLAGLQGLHPLAIMMGVCLVVTFLTEITSNTAITTLLMPILAAVAVAAGQSSATMMLPAALAASMAFMLPVATPPNAVVYGSGRVSIAFMARTGFWMNLAGVPVVALLVWLLTG